jgi:hypothetical protein
VAGQLSPDGQYYWDGAGWVTAVSPDGAWRWDGSSWRSAGLPSGSAGRVPALVAGGIVAALLIGGLGVVAAIRLLPLQTAAARTSASPACAGTAGLPGSHLAEGDLVCGRKLGASYLTADCTASNSVPPEVDAIQIASAGADWTPADIGADAGGCELAANPDQIVELDSKDLESPNTVLIADFVPINHVGGLGLRLACIQSASCVDISLYSDGTFSLDEGKTGSDGWKNITEGSLGLATLKVGQPNRLILRYSLGVAYVFLNGVPVTHGAPTFGQLSGYAGFYIDDQQSPSPEHVQLRQLYAFGS